MNKNVMFSLIFLLIGGVLGFGAGRLGNVALQSSPEFQKLQAQIEQARKMLPETPADMQSIGGTVTDVRANSFTLETSSFNPFDDFQKTRTVTTNAETKIFLLKQKDEARYRDEAAAYWKLIRNGTYGKNPVTSPNSFEESTGTVSDIQKGQFVNVQADHNIRDEKSFTATEVRVQLPSQNR